MLGGDDAALEQADLSVRDHAIMPQWKSPTFLLGHGFLGCPNIGDLKRYIRCFRQCPKRLLLGFRKEAAGYFFGPFHGDKLLNVQADMPAAHQ